MSNAQNAAMSIMNLVGKRMSKTVKFCDGQVTINKLSVADVTTIQEQSKDAADNPEKGFDILQTVVKLSVEGASELTEENFKGFPMDELAKLSEEIMKFSGVAGDKNAKSGN